MSEFLLIVLAAIAAGITVFVASKIAATTISFSVVKGIIGAVAAIVIELVRILIAMQIVGVFVTGQPSATTVWLVNLRLLNIPILVGIGFLLAYGAAQKPAQPSSETPIIENTPDKDTK